MIEVDNLIKKYGDTTAVAGMTFTVKPGVVTGFLGPNGAGKSTTMRAIVGLDAPTAGSTRVNGRAYAASRAPLAEVGALLDGKAFDKSRSARNHLRAVGATVGVGNSRVEELLETVGLADVAHRKAGEFSLGMGQRLGIATALLADPPVLMLDEPTNGLDPDGIQWIRSLARELAAEGRTVFISSHLMSEMELTADHLVIVGAGRVIADESMVSLIDRTSGASVSVRTPRAGELATALAGAGIEISQSANSQLEIRGLTCEQVGDTAAAQGIALHQLQTRRLTLEEAFMNLTHDSQTYHAGSTPAASAPAAPTHAASTGETNHE